MFVTRILLPKMPARLKLFEHKMIFNVIVFGFIDKNIHLFMCILMLKTIDKAQNTYNSVQLHKWS